MLLYQIGITLLPGIGDITGKKLVAYCGGVEAVFREKKKNIQKIPGIGGKLLNSILNNNVLKHAEQEIEFIKKYKIKTLFYLDKDYPQRLKNCVDGPMLLYYKGSADLNTQKIISFVGTRKATKYGKEMCSELISKISGPDTLIVSGLAYGIDSCSHRAALDNNLPTIGVLAHGLDRIYPATNKNLAEKMIKNGGLLTDFMSRTNPDRENFPKRNRIIAGLSDAIVVVESGRRGGALITAEIANSYNRDVFCVPGKIGDKYSEGCNFFIKTHKAALIQSAEDIKYVMGWMDKPGKNAPKQRELFIEFTEDEQKIVDFLKENNETGIDMICGKCQLPTSKVAAALLNLEFQGIVNSLPGKIYKLIV